MTIPKYKNHFCQSSKNEGSYTRFLRYLADVNQAENKIIYEMEFGALINFKQKEKFNTNSNIM